MKIADYINALPDSYDKAIPDIGAPKPQDNAVLGKARLGEMVLGNAKNSVLRGNNYKLLLIDQSGVEALRTDIEAVQDTLDISKATGKTLDLYGEMYGKARGNATDDQYRVLITQKVAQNMVGGDYNSVVTAFAMALGVEPTSFKLEETGDCEVAIKDLPYSVLQTAGMTAEQMIKTIQGFLPVGVHLAPIELSGTFEFAATADEYDENAGFAISHTNQSIGGKLGTFAS